MDSDSALEGRSALQDELMRSDVRLRRLVDAGRRLGSSLDRQTIYRVMQDIIEQAMPCDGFLVSSFDAEGGLIRCEYALVSGNVLDPSGFPPVAYMPQGGMQSMVIRTGESLVFGDVRERVHEAGGTYYDVTPEGSATLIKEEDQPKTQTMAMVPIKLEGNVVGVVQVSSHTAPITRKIKSIC